MEALLQTRDSHTLYFAKAHRILINDLHKINRITGHFIKSCLQCRQDISLLMEEAIDPEQWLKIRHDTFIM